MAVPMNISSHREVGNPTVKIDKGTKKRANETPYQNKKKMREEDHETTYDKTITTPKCTISISRCKRQTKRSHATRRLRYPMHDKH